MNRSETARILAAMAAFDRRTVGDSDVIAWHAVLSDVDYEDALMAVRNWYTRNTEWIMPAHVRKLVEDIQRERQVSPWAPGQYGVPRESAYPQIAPEVRPGPVSEAIRDFLARLSPGSWAALHPRRAAWAREHQAYRRQAGAEPNPHYDPTAVARLRDGVDSGQTAIPEEDP